MNRDALDLLSEAFDANALSDLLYALSMTIDAAETTSTAVADAADRWQENLICEDLWTIRSDLKKISSRVMSLADDARKHAAEARKQYDLLIERESDTSSEA